MEIPLVYSSDEKPKFVDSIMKKNQLEIDYDSMYDKITIKTYNRI